MARTKRARTSTSTRNLDIEVLSISSDSSEEVLVENQGTQNVSNELIVSAVEVVEAHPVTRQTLEDLGPNTSSDEEEQDPEPTSTSSVPTSTVRSSESRRFTIKQRIIEKEVTVQLLEHDLLSGLVGALKVQIRSVQ